MHNVMVVFKRESNGTLTEVGSSGQGETTFEQYTQLAPTPGTYVVRVIYFAAVGQAEGVWEMQDSLGQAVLAKRKDGRFSATVTLPAGKVLFDARGAGR